MSNVITIDLQVKGAAQLTSTLNRASQAINRFNQGSGNIGRNITAANSAASRTPGVFSRAAAARADLVKARASGDPMAILDAMHRNRTAQSSANRAYSKLMPQHPAFAGAGKSGGLGAVGDMLVTQLASPLGIATAALALFSAGVKAGAAEIAQFRNRVDRMSTDSKGASRVGRYADYLGEEPNTSGVHQRLQEGGPGAAAVNKYTGYRARSGYYGSIDEAESYTNAARAVRAARSDDEARRIARDLGDPGLYDLRRLSDKEFAEMNRGNEFDLKAESERRARRAELQRRLKGFSEVGQVAEDYVVRGLNRVFTPNPGLSGMIPGSGARVDDSKTEAEKLTKAIEKLTGAVEDNTQTKEGSFGKSGPRANRRSDAAATYKFIEEDARRAQAQLGGYKI